MVEHASDVIIVSPTCRLTGHDLREFRLVTPVGRSVFQLGAAIVAPAELWNFSLFTRKGKEFRRLAGRNRDQVTTQQSVKHQLARPDGGDMHAVGDPCRGKKRLERVGRERHDIGAAGRFFRR